MKTLIDSFDKIAEYALNFVNECIDDKETETKLLQKDINKLYSAIQKINHQYEIITNQKFNYEGYHKIPSFCYIDIYRYPNFTIVIATEPDYNEEGSGTSITNRAEHIATEVSKKYNIPMIELTWIEHYNRVSNIKKEETWDLVFFNREKTPVRGYWGYPNGEMVFTNPQWYHITSEQKNNLINGCINTLKELKSLKKEKPWIIS